jgi:hypothetical protein
MSHLNLSNFFLTLYKIEGRSKRPLTYECKKEFNSGK